MKRIFFSPILATTLLLSAAHSREPLDFNRDIRPILSEKCYSCHGADEGSRKAKLRLDVRAEALKERDGVRAIVPGDMAASELVVRIMSEDPEEVMPPPKEHHKLTDVEREKLKTWIAQGAEYAAHWAFVAPARTGAPRTELRNVIDGFIRTRLTREALAPSPEADRHTLLRRVSLDLTGLPPTPEEVRAFIANGSPQAYEQAVDRLLASPAYGERWAKMWLDLARYADSTGYGSDAFRLNIWPWRDWVIGALNRNVPYDQFTIEQLAGDLLPNATPEQITATAFHRNTMTNIEGGTDDEEYRVAAVKDRVATTMQVWMGLTAQCAQCHSHKFDPISHREYYQLFAVFNQTEDADRGDEAPRLPVPTAQELEQRAKLTADLAALNARMNQASPEIESEQHAWEAEMLRPAEWSAFTDVEVKSTSGARYEVRPDGTVVLLSMPAPDKDVVKVIARSRQAGITAFHLEAVADGPIGRAPNHNAVLSEFQVATAPARASAQARGRRVRVTLPGSGKPLSLAEIEVFSGGVNIAPSGQAKQSSTDFGGEAGRANDGKTGGQFYQDKSVTHTRTEKDPWWEVDLGVDTEIERIVVWNRTDGNVGERLANFVMSVSDSAGARVWEGTFAEPPRPSLAISPIDGMPVALANPSADFAQDGWPASAAIDGKSQTGWAFLPDVHTSHAAIFATKKPFTASGENSETRLTFTLRQEHGGQHVLGAFRLSATTQNPPPRELPAAIRAILTIEPSEREPAQRAELATYFRPLSKHVAALRTQLEAKQTELAKIKPVELPIMREKPATKRRTTWILNKGNFTQHGAEVTPGLLEAFSPPAPPDVDRLALAHWLVSPENPLTARVAVNRFWAQLFGSGIVESEEDFGTQGQLPSHPELLDALALSFMESGWDVKALLREIVLSATYRQSARVRPEHLQKDPRNRLLAHYPRRRLDAEGVRDQALLVSGLLSRKIGGPSVYPPQPAGLWNVAFNGGQNAYPTSTGEDRYRRGLYTFWRRTMPNPTMTTFDAPSRETCTLRRAPTNTPLQAFVTLNDPVFVECAQALARRILREGGSDSEARLRYGLQLVLARPPADSQVATLRSLLDQAFNDLRNDPTAAVKLATEPFGPLPDGADAIETGAWTVIANVLLNLDGVLTRS